jgi:hypothetical protein
MVDAVTGDAARSEAAGIGPTTARPEAPSNSINSRLPRTRRTAFFFLSMAHGAHQAAVLTIQAEPTSGALEEWSANRTQFHDFSGHARKLNR